MAEQLATSTADTYGPPAAPTCGFGPNADTDAIAFDVGNQPVLYQVWRRSDQGLKYELDPSELRRTPSLGNVIRDVAGIQFRSAVAGSPAVVIATRFLKADATLSPGVGFDGSLSSQGGLTPGQAQVNEYHNGVLVGSEPGIDLVDGAAAAIGIPGISFTAVDVAGSRVSYTPVLTAPLSSVLDYKTATADATIMATSEGTANTVLISDSFTPDGVTPVEVQFFSPGVENTSANVTAVVLVLLRDSTVVAGKFANPNFSGVVSDTSRVPVYASFRETPTNAAHTYTVKAYCTGSGNGLVHAGAGGSGNFPPMFLRIRYDT